MLKLNKLKKINHKSKTMGAISSKSQLMLQYETAEIVVPPETLSPIYISKHQSDATLKGLAVSYSLIPKQYREGCQLFEVPLIADDCQRYCGRGYSLLSDTEGPYWDREGWEQLADKTDFSCRKRFSKVFVYDCHYGRQWGDGTILEKFGYTRYGATPVYRFTDPNHPFIVKCCGPVESVWIQKLDQEAPCPSYRFESTYAGGDCIDCELSSSLDEVLLSSVTPYEEIYADLLVQKKKLLKLLPLKEEKLASEGEEKTPEGEEKIDSSPVSRPL